MTSWGGYDNHLRVGIDWTISPANPGPSDTTVDVTWKFWVDSDGWSWNDNQSLHEDADNWGGTTTSYSFNTTGSKLVDTKTVTYAISTNSGSVHANANVSGAYNGATPSHSVTVNLPDRPNSTPDAPTWSTTTGITSSGFTANLSAASGAGNGLAVDDEQIQYDNNSGFTSPTTTSKGSGGTSWAKSITGLTPPGSTWYTRGRLHNSAGWGPWSGTHTQTLTATAPATPAVPTRTATTATTATVAWSAPANNGSAITSYTCEISTSSSFATILATYTGSSLSHQFTGLTGSSTYYVRVRATNAIGTSANSGTLVVMTPSPPVYTDTGDYVSLVNNLADGIASKIAHLGTFIARGKTSGVTMNNTTTTFFDPGTGSVGEAQALSGMSGGLPDPPTYTGPNGTATGAITIQYPGTYRIEWAIGVPGNTGTASSIQMVTYINGQSSPDVSNAKGGMPESVGWSSNQQGAAACQSIVRRLNAGDTIAFAARQASGGNVTTTVINGTTLTMYCRVTMIGF